jgi:transcriptional regulator with XRE-family HTH domain
MMKSDSQSTLSRRIREAREAADLTQAELAKSFGIEPKAVSQWERDPAHAKRKPARPDIDKIPALAERLGVTVDWLLTGKTTPPALPQIPVVGYVGAGAEIFLVDDLAKGQRIDEAPPFPGQDGPAVAVRVRGDSMLPEIEDGYTLYYSRNRDGVPSACLGRLCVVQVHDGPVLVKKLEKGLRTGLFRLHSSNASPRENVRLDWAARVLAIIP